VTPKQSDLLDGGAKIAARMDDKKQLLALLDFAGG
jgi:hypothetical protein